MATEDAKVFITKLGAAERQLNAAIRMTLAGEDELAIHTVAAAAARLLRDISQARGRNTTHVIFASALWAMAQDVLAGRPLPPEIAGVSSLMRVIDYIVREIKDGKIMNATDVIDRSSGRILHRLMKHRRVMIRELAASMSLENIVIG